MSKLTTFAAGAGLGTAILYFLDSNSGARRRSVAREKASKYVRQGADAVQVAGMQAQGTAAGVRHAVAGGDSAPAEDQTLKNKVETEIFRPAQAPKGDVNVLVVDGVVELRGQVEDAAQREGLEQAARKVTGVLDVRNLLHLPGETPPNIVGTPGAA